MTEFTLLVSPDAFDLSQPIKVTANGKTVFNAKIEPSTATLLKWAARDNDRTMLYAAELKIILTCPGKPSERAYCAVVVD